jgi:hypothetical protein
VPPEPPADRGQNRQRHDDRRSDHELNREVTRSGHVGQVDEDVWESAGAVQQYAVRSVREERHQQTCAAAAEIEGQGKLDFPIVVEVGDSDSDQC